MRTRIATALTATTVALLALAPGAASAADEAPAPPTSPLIDLSNAVRLPDITILSPSQSQACAGSQQQWVLLQQQTCTPGATG